MGRLPIRHACRRGRVEEQGVSLSLESFTTLVLGGGNVTPLPIRLFGYLEGFIGAFLIALFVFTLTRSIRR